MAAILINRLAVAFVRFYQKILSPITVGSCRYYPSCSEYSVWQFENNNFFYALLFSLLRILRCNKLFTGGIEYPKTLFKPPKVTLFLQNREKNIKYFIVPQKKEYLIVKIWDR